MGASRRKKGAASTMSNMPEKIWVSDPALNCKDGEICLAFDKEAYGVLVTVSTVTEETNYIGS